MYITSLGCEWLERELEVTSENYKEVVDKYVEETKDKAAALVRKWKGNGEDECLVLYIEPMSNNQLYRDTAAYVEYVDNE